MRVQSGARNVKSKVIASSHSFHVYWGNLGHMCLGKSSGSHLGVKRARPFSANKFVDRLVTRVSSHPNPLVAEVHFDPIPIGRGAVRLFVGGQPRV